MPDERRDPPLTVAKDVYDNIVHGKHRDTTRREPRF
jgi:hypothetical protein